MTKIVSSDSLDLAAHIRPGDKVVVGQGTAEPRSLTEALIRQQDRFAGAEVFLGAVFSDTFVPDKTPHLRFAGYGGIGRGAALSKAGRLDVYPLHYGALGEAYASGLLRADVVLIQLSAALPGRGETLGLANDYVALAARHARTVIAEVHPDAPWTHGAELPKDIKIDVRVAGTQPLVELKGGKIGETEQKIAALIVGLIPERATLQIGIGSIPDAILDGLTHHRDLGFHSGLVSDRIADLIEAGVITNAFKTIDRGVSVGGVLLGTQRLNKLAHDFAALRVLPPSYTHAQEVLRQIDNLVAINSAIEVDLTGQVNAETVDGVYMGAVGGQVDFVRGANAAKGGRAIIALPATAKGGTLSRIVPSVTTVTTARSDVDAIVTEFGVAELRGCSLAERQRRLIKIAAPQFRETLERSLQGA